MNSNVLFHYLRAWVPICFSCESMESKDDSNGLCEPKGLFIKDRKQDQVELRFKNLYYTVSLGFGKGETAINAHIMFRS